MTTRRLGMTITSLGAGLTAFFAASLAGCTSVYHVMMQDMTLGQRETLTSRMTEVRDQNISARDTFQAAFTQIHAMGDAEQVDAAAHQKLAQVINRAELETWNLRRRIASVEDVAGTQMSTLAHFQTSMRTRSELVERVTHATDQMHSAHREMTHVIEGLQQQAAILRADVDLRSVRSLQPITALTPADQAMFIARIDDVIRNLDELVIQLSTDDDNAATDQALALAAAR